VPKDERKNLFKDVPLRKTTDAILPSEKVPIPKRIAKQADKDKMKRGKYHKKVYATKQSFGIQASINSFKSF
jgi:hypothetical protein